MVAGAGMGSGRVVLWLGEVDDARAAEVGGKATRLAALRRAGAPVPDGFCVVASAYRRFLAGNGLGSLVADLARDLGRGVDEAELRARAARITQEIEGRELDDETAAQLESALAELHGSSGALLAVRSSASAEDLDGASFAGQLETCLSVPAAGVPRAIRRCWASLWTDRAIRYRVERRVDHLRATMAVLVQPMVPCDVAGVAFSLHPVTGADEIVVEGAWGLGEALAQGEVTPDRYVLDKLTLAEVQPAHVGRKAWRRVAEPTGGTRLEEVPTERQLVRALTPERLARVGRLTLDLEGRFGRPQDVEWGFAGDCLYVFQTRPVTALAARSVYTDVLPADVACWTSGFLEERFPEPLSPLGWSVIQRGFEEYALRDPLRYLGCDDLGQLPLTRLHRGHPYVNVEVFRRLYKLFPDALVPEDAWRYFPRGDTASRKLAAVPRSILDPRLWWRLLRSWVQDPGNWSPLHNHREWERFVRGYEGAVTDAEREMDGQPDLDLPGILRCAAAIEEANGRLLRIHRWSLTHADLLYTLLRRLARAWIGPGYAAICSSLVAYLSDRSLEMDAELHRLVERARRSPAVAAALRTAAPVSELGEQLAGDEAGADFLADVRRFLASYGHRSLSLDVLHPSFAADTSQLARLLASLVEEGGVPRNQQARREAALEEARRVIRASPWGLLRWSAFRRLLGLTQTYVRLREDQRFHWQKGLAALRKAYLRAGERLAALGALAEPGDVFYLLKREVEALAAGQAEPASLHRLASVRRAEHVDLCAEYERSPRESYPRFLQGGRPLELETAPGVGERLKGQPVSPGRARGRVKVVLTPDELPDLRPGDVLVTRGADPGWTPLFGKIGGLVMEAGGQLSHGSVVAREYGIPAVVGIPNATTALRDGDLVIVDGEAGTVAQVAV